jgi:hypothetical protein
MTRQTGALAGEMSRGPSPVRRSASGLAVLPDGAGADADPLTREAADCRTAYRGGRGSRRARAQRAQRAASPAAAAACCANYYSLVITRPACR